MIPPPPTHIIIPVIPPGGGVEYLRSGFHNVRKFRRHLVPPLSFFVIFNLDDESGGNGNGRAEAGETVKLYFTLSNLWLPITGTVVTGSADTAGINFSVVSAALGTIGTGGSANNASAPIIFEVAPDFPRKTGAPSFCMLRGTVEPTPMISK